MGAGFTNDDSPTPKRPALLASARRIRLSEKPTIRKTEEWQRDAWNGYKNVGEIQHAVDYIANHVSKVRLFGAMVPKDPRDIPSTDDNPLADAAITSLRTEGGEYSSVLRDVTINLYVAGDCFLVGRGSGLEKEVPFWEVLSTDELTVTDDRFLIQDYPSAPRKEYTDQQIVVIRIMFRDPQWGGLPISPLRGILASSEEVQRIERVIRAAARSRSAGPGLLLVPDEASFGSPDPTTESSDDTTDPFIQALMDGMMEPIRDEGSASAVIPLILRAPADVLKEIRKLSLAIDVDTELIKLDRALTRLAQGLPLPPEIVTGKAGLSHWTSWSVDESVITAYIEPVLAPVVSAFTTEYYRPYLIAAGMSESDARERQLWYDVTQLVTRPNRSADADFGLEHIAISDSEWRKVKGFTDESAPTPLEKLARLLLQRGSLDPLSTVTLLKVLKIIPEDTELPTSVQVPPTPQPQKAIAPESRTPPPRTRNTDDAPPRRSASALIFLPSDTPDEDHISLQLAELDRDLRIRLHTAAEAAVHRAIEKAQGTVIFKMRRKPRYKTIMRDVNKLEAAATVGRTSLEAEGVFASDLFIGSFDSFITKFKDWTARTYAKSSRILSTPISTPTDLIDAAADALNSDLTNLSISLLFNQPTGDPSGEYDDSATIPHGIIRKALYHAGGGTTVLPEGLSVGCISTGQNVLRALVDAGGEVYGWEWQYSTASRTRDFEPHANLNGMRFSSFSDRVLRNAGTWPPVTSHYAGDHPHCLCQVRPLIHLPPVESSEATA